MARTLNALDLLRRDHARLHALFRRFERSDALDEQRELREQIVSELKIHTEIEERVFYPYLREATAREDLFQEASIEHDVARHLLEELPQEQPGSPRLRAMVKVLAGQVQHHVQEEEGRIFPQVERTGVDLQALGEALEACRSGQPPLQLDAQDGEQAEGRSRGKREAGVEAKTGAGGKPRADDGRAQAEDDERFLHEHGEGLSRSAQRAKWIHTPGERADRDGQTLATCSLEVIRAWAEARGGRPATSPNGDTERPHVLRFDFPDYDKGLQPVSWEAWGRAFEERDLVFLYQETLKAGKQSNFFRLDNPEREDG